jgi:hypothetical protein
MTRTKYICDLCCEREIRVSGEKYYGLAFVLGVGTGGMGWGFRSDLDTLSGEVCETCYRRYLEASAEFLAALGRPQHKWVWERALK